jgi:hypothetical protein
MRRNATQFQSEVEEGGGEQVGVVGVVVAVSWL